LLPCGKDLLLLLLLLWLLAVRPLHPSACWVAWQEASLLLLLLLVVVVVAVVLAVLRLPLHQHQQLLQQPTAGAGCPPLAALHLPWMFSYALGLLLLLQAWSPEGSSTRVCGCNYHRHLH
jgi:hypothetical protein